MKTQYIHYGSSEFHPELMMSIHNREMMVKPDGGLWASPVNTERGWVDWCTTESFYLENLKKSFKFTLTDNAKILHVYSVKDLEDLPKVKPPFGLEHFTSWVLIDFEKLQEDYDGIELHLSEEKWEDIAGFGEGLYFKLYGWDCDSILIFHSDVVVCEGEK